MRNFELTDDYTEVQKIELQKNVKLAVWVNILSLVLGVGLFVIGCSIKPVVISFIYKEDPFNLVYKMIAVVASIFVYMILHELIHGYFFKKFSGIKAEYGFAGLNFYSKSEEYYTKKEHVIIVLAPIFILGIVLVILNFALGMELFWYVFLVQIANVAGGAGDLYMVFFLRKFPKNILIRDFGVAISVYQKNNK